MMEFNENALLKTILKHRKQNELDSKNFLLIWPKIEKIFKILFLKRQKCIQHLTSENEFSNFFHIEVKLVCLMNIVIHEDFDGPYSNLTKYIERNLKYAYTDYFECVLDLPTVYQEVSILAKSKFWQTTPTTFDL
ncbi:hypothetical protein [Enterococcus gallinarum]|uniref:hypothetical protein n=1 Tax=Enterococcus gallinarum TaxID=1353 RepID=UPI001AD7A54A|nr:hypothetical protein [Enterococcus gallinarum]MBO6419993.1 hypothetical protein [Enterococcus gallinarum]MBO6422990.1 hypothetical protein [Enterococcus gallinarum]